MSKSKISQLKAGVNKIKTDSTIHYNMVKNFNLFFNVSDAAMDLAQDIVVKQRELYRLLKEDIKGYNRKDM